MVWAMLALAVAAHASALRVWVQDGAPQVETGSAAAVALVRPDESLWVMAPVAKLDMGDLKGLASTWTVDPVKVGGGAGVRIGSAVPRAWGVVRSTSGWRVAVGLGKAAPAAVGIIHLKDETLTEGGGARLVGIGPTGERVVGVAMAGAGADGLLGGSGGAAPVRLAAVEPAEGKVGEAVKAAADKMAPSLGVGPTEKNAKGEVVKVGVRPAGEKLAAVVTPTVVREELKISATETATAPAVPAYKNGAWVPFALPAGWHWQGGRAVSDRVDAAAKRAMEADMAKMALDAAVRKVADVVSATQALNTPAAESATDVVASVAAMLNPSKTTPAPQYGPVPKVGAGGDVPLWTEVDPKDWAAAWAAREGDLQKAMAVCLGDRANPLPLSPAEMEKLKQQGGGGREAPKHAAWADMLVRSAVAEEAAPEGKPVHEALITDPKDKAVVPWTMRDWRGCERAPQVMGIRRDLARLALGNGRVQEALSQLDLIPVRTAEGDLLRAMADVMRHNSKRAMPLLEAVSDQVPSLRPEAKAWKTVALQQQGNSGGAMDTWPKTGGEQVLGRYPSYLRLVLQKSLAEAMVAVSDPVAAQAYVDELADDFAVTAKDPSETVPPWLERLQGLARLGGPKEVAGLRKLARAAEQKTDPATAWQAKYDFVKALEKRGELPPPQVIAYLEELSMFWRGDALERSVLRTLGDLRLKEGDPAGALANWETLVKAYPNDPGMADVAAKMQDAMVAAFDPEAAHALEPLQVAGLYYDFKELVPDSTVGDKMTEKVAQSLVSLGLDDRAEPLLETLLNFRLKEPVDQARVALELGDVQGRLGKDADRLKMLDAWKKVMVGTVPDHAWKMQEAEAYLNLKRYDRALQSLQGMDGEDVESLRAKIAWEGKNWSAADKALGGLVDGMTPVSSTVPPEVLELAFTRGALKDGAGLERVAQKFKPALENDKTAGTLVAALAAQAGVKQTGLGADTAPLGRIARVLSALNALEDGVVRSRILAKDEAVEQEDYNDKMRYMELLPPPAL